MPDYVAYALTREGSVKTYTVLAAKEDADAIAQARQLVQSDPVEVWLGPRRIVRLDPRRL